MKNTYWNNFFLGISNMKKILLYSTIQISILREYNGVSKELAIKMFKSELNALKWKIELNPEIDAVYLDEIIIEDEK